MSGYRKFSDQWRRGGEQTFATFAAFAGGHRETSNPTPSGAGVRRLVQQQQHTIDIINVVTSNPAFVSDELRPPSPAKVAKAPPPIEGRPPDWWRDEFEERAAIREFDGGYSRAEAERFAWGELQ